mmetsp:Transcript_4204/g.4871  ORF Transcript_4204/g.4871 Transcript_4204/m.4871 type:complete len:193 (+) Transcript_4204:97-675(+)
MTVFNRIRAASVSSLAEDSTTGSPFRSIQYKCTICLPPAYIGRTQQGIEELLNARLLKYDPRLGGVLLTYSDIEVLGSIGRVFNELPEILYEVSLKALIFTTAEGMRMKGTVKDVTAGHITLLVCGAFQVSISKEQINRRFKFNVSSTSWRDGDEVIKSGSDVWFKVCSVKSESGAWFIDGSILEDNLGVDL